MPEYKLTGDAVMNRQNKDSFGINYQPTEGEKKFTFFYIRISAFLGLIWLFHWILQIATR